MEYRVIAASPYWSLNGVNVFSEILVRGLVARGVMANVVITGDEGQDQKPMPLPPDLPVDRLPARGGLGWHARWRAMIAYLEDRAPCIYMPNHDRAMSCISPRLSERVGIVGVMHSNDHLSFEHAARMGRYWNAIVAVSRAIAQKTAALDPAFSSRLYTVPSGVSIPGRPPMRPGAGKPLKIIYAGVLDQSAKRVFDLPLIMEALRERKTPVELSIAGGGPEQERLREAMEPFTRTGSARFLGIVPHDRVPGLFAEHDVFILTSNSEGFPISLIEAMAQGCIPVVSWVESGVPEVVQDGESGWLVRVGDVETFADRLAGLARDPEQRRRMEARAYAAVRDGGYSIEAMADKYLGVFERVMAEIESGAYHRPAGRIALPPGLWKDWLPKPLRLGARAVKRLLGPRSD